MVLHSRSTQIVIFGLAGLVACGEDPSPTQFTDGGESIPVEKGQSLTWNYDEGSKGELPSELVSVLGEWSIHADEAAPSNPHVLKQAGRFRDPDFPRVVVKNHSFNDLTLRVRCRPEDGETDQACGLMFRLKDSDNYYLTRANALEGNVRLYAVVDGDRDELESADVDVATGAWSTLEAIAHGTSLVVKWNGSEVLRGTDSTYGSGKVGLWTKADSITAFDDFTATAE